ncbi:MAG: hypothetical protein JXR46_11925 [Calditrichaceae bacterium]|nr:hypothetical protein [Calditrichaceae bacterium]MBN2709743.1 hypothetical protein [Calditrichaceae bacterium]RQV94937.1 MAG: hypothetical protein EH224_08675 [Calditrichota bacterium]
MISLISIYTAGILTLFMTIFHVQFYNKFGWAKDFKNIRPLNQKILYTIHMALIILFILIGIITLIYSKELAQSSGLAMGINLSLAIFWLWRLVWQILYFEKINALAVVLIVWFLLLSAAYILPVVLVLV